MKKSYHNGGHEKFLELFKDRNLRSAIMKSYGTSEIGTCKEGQFQ